MPRVPTYGEAKVQSQGLRPQFSNLNTDTGADALARGVGQFASGVENAVSAHEQKANALAVTEMETRFQREVTTGMVGDSTSGDPTQTGEFREGEWGLDTRPGATNKAGPKGFLSLKGTAAAEKSAETMEWLDKRQKELAQELANQKARDLFLLRTGGVKEDTRRRIEGHVATQGQAAMVAALDARSAAALSEVAVSYRDPATVARQQAAVEGPIRALQLSKEDGDARVALWRAQVAGVRLEQFLAAKDWRGAEELFAEVKPMLGPKAAQFEKVISAVKMDQQAERYAADFVESARDPATGRVDSAKAVASVDAVPEGPLRDEVRQRAEHRVAVEGKAWNQRVDGVYGRAFSTYLKNGTLSAVDSKDKAWLVENAPEEWRKLQMMGRSDAGYARDRARERTSGGGETDAQREALLRLKADLVENRERYNEMTPEEFTREWGHQLSPGGYNHAGTLLAAAKKEPPGSSGEFSRFVNDEVRGSPSLKSKRTQDQFRAFMGDQRRDFLARNKREPSYEEMEAMRQSAWTTTHEKGWLWDSEFAPAFKRRTEEKAGAPRPPSLPPPTSLDKPTKQDRIRQLKGKVSAAEAVRILTAEGY